MSLTPSTPGQMGFLVLNSDTGAVLTSGGDMQVGDVLVTFDINN